MRFVYTWFCLAYTEMITFYVKNENIRVQSPIGAAKHGCHHIYYAKSGCKICKWKIQGDMLSPRCWLARDEIAEDRDGWLSLRNGGSTIWMAVRYGAPVGARRSAERSNFDEVSYIEKNRSRIRGLKVALLLKVHYRQKNPKL